MSTNNISAKNLRGIYKELAAYGKVPRADTVEEMVENLRNVVHEYGFRIPKINRGELARFAADLIGERNWFQEVGNPYDDDESEVEVEPTKRTQLVRAELDSLERDVKFLGYDFSGDVKNKNRQINKILEDEEYKGPRNINAKIDLISNLAREA